MFLFLVLQIYISPPLTDNPHNVTYGFGIRKILPRARFFSFASLPYFFFFFVFLAGRFIRFGLVCLFLLWMPAVGPHGFLIPCEWNVFNIHRMPFDGGCGYGPRLAETMALSHSCRHRHRRCLV